MYFIPSLSSSISLVDSSCSVCRTWIIFCRSWILESSVTRTLQPPSTVMVFQSYHPFFIVVYFFLDACDLFPPVSADEHFAILLFQVDGHQLPYFGSVSVPQGCSAVCRTRWDPSCLVLALGKSERNAPSASSLGTSLDNLFISCLDETGTARSCHLCCNLKHGGWRHDPVKAMRVLTVWRQAAESGERWPQLQQLAFLAQSVFR